MINILTGQDLWEYVDGTMTLPSDLASQLGWRKRIGLRYQQSDSGWPTKCWCMLRV